MPQMELSDTLCPQTVQELVDVLKNYTYVEIKRFLNASQKRVVRIISTPCNLLEFLMQSRVEVNFALIEALRPNLTRYFEDKETLFTAVRFMNSLSILVICQTLGVPGLEQRFQHPKDIVEFFSLLDSEARDLLILYFGHWLSRQFQKSSYLLDFLTYLNASQVRVFFGYFSESDKNLALLFLKRLLQCCQNAPGIWSLQSNNAELRAFFLQHLRFEDTISVFYLPELSTLYEALGSEVFMDLCPNLSQLMHLIHLGDDEAHRLCILHIVCPQLCQQTVSVEGLIMVLSDASSEFAKTYLETLGIDNLRHLIDSPKKCMMFLSSVSLASRQFVSRERPGLLMQDVKNIQDLAERFVYLDEQSQNSILEKYYANTLFFMCENAHQFVRAMEYLEEAKQWVFIKKFCPYLTQFFKTVRDWSALLDVLENHSAAYVIQRYQRHLIRMVKNEVDRSLLLASFSRHEAAYSELLDKKFVNIRFFAPAKLPNPLESPESSDGRQSRLGNPNV